MGNTRLPMTFGGPYETPVSPGRNLCAQTCSLWSSGPLFLNITTILMRLQGFSLLRDGVSEGQFRAVLETEVDAMKRVSFCRAPNLIC